MPAVLRAVAMSLLPGRVRFLAVSLVRRWWQAGELGEDASPEEVVGRLLDLSGCRSPAAPLVQRAERLAADASRRGLWALAFSDPAYPSCLAEVSDAPAVLWGRGRRDLFSAPAVAVVGSRAALESAVYAARQLAEGLAAAGVVVVSGLARGVDAAAHEGALATGATVAVLGCGVDVVYPPEHDALASRVHQSGALVSEFAPGTAPRRHHFPLRNRIISGLSRAVVVVEAAERSGALITARTALDQGREVMAMPGPVAGGRNRGAHALIRDGALLVESAEDVLAALRGLPQAEGQLAGLAETTDPVLESLAPGEEAEIDALVGRTGLDGPSVVARVSQWELQGWVQRVPGGRIIRLSRKW